MNMGTENEGQHPEEQSTQGSPEQAQQPISPEAVRLQEERKKTLEYIDRRLDLTDAEGKPLSKEAADLAIRSAQHESMDMMADILAAQMAGKPVDQARLERATFLGARAQDLAYRQSRDETASLEATLKGIYSENVFAKRSGEGLKSLLGTPTHGEDTSAMQQQVLDNLTQWTQPEPEDPNRKVNHIAEYRAKAEGTQPPAPEPPTE